jgi:tRNA-dependent cyclodipeptide synthase
MATTSAPNVTIKHSTSLIEVLSFLDGKQIKYKVSHLSPSCTREEIERELSRLGMGLLQAVPIDLAGQGLVLAIIPSSLALDSAEFSKSLPLGRVRPLAPDEIRQRFALDLSANIIPPLGALFGINTSLSPLIEQHRTVGFLVESGNTLITLEISEFRKTIINSSATPIPTRPKYRAYSSPGRKANQRCILGVSLESADFQTTKLITITDWIRNQYADCVVMLGDGLHRITVQLESDASESEALEYSKWLARDFVYSQLSVFRFRQSRCRFNFVFCSEIQNTGPYRDYYKQLFDLFTDNKEFQNSVTDFSSEFLRRRPQRQEHLEGNMRMSCRYILEELAVICCLAQEAPCTFVYPGSLSILQEIANGEHPSVPAYLLQVDYVELKLKSRDKK